MGIYSRHLLYLFVGPFVGVFLFLQLFVGLCGMLAVLGRYPYLPLVDLAVGLPDLVLIALPLTLPLALLAGYLLFARGVQGRRLLLWAELAGRDPRLLQVPILVLGVLFSLLLWWLSADVIPKAEFQSLASVSRLTDDTARIAARVAWGRDLLPGFDFAFRGVEGGRLVRFSMVTNREQVATAITAETADAELIPIRPLEDGRFLQINLHNGRFVRVQWHEDGTPKLLLNMRFEALRLRQDARQFTQPSKARVLDPKYYANAELSKLPEQLRLLSRKGLPISDRERRRASSGPATAFARLQGALLPLQFLLVAVLVLGRHTEGRLWRRAIFAACVCLVLLLPQYLLLERRARNAALSADWLPLLPSLELAAGLVFWLAVGVVKRGRAK